MCSIKYSGDVSEIAKIIDENNLNRDPNMMEYLLKIILLYEQLVKEYDELETKSDKSSVNLIKNLLIK